MSEMITLGYDLSFIGAIIALLLYAIRTLLYVEYIRSPKGWKAELYKVLWTFQQTFTAMSAVGGLMVLLYIYLQIRG